MKHRKLFALTAMLLIFSLLFSACGNLASGKETTEGKNMDIMQKNNPAEDDTINILMIGNSFCYYYVDELYGMAKAAGIKMRVCNVYQSGCTLEQHHTWWKNGESNYFYYTTDENGRVEVQQTNLEYCLSQQNWDVISLQEASSKMYKNNISVPDYLMQTKPYLDDLWSYIKEQFPMSRYLWHGTWTYQVGYDIGGYQMTSLQQQETNTKIAMEYSKKVCENYDLELVNTGDAWQIVRQGGYDNMCARKSVNSGEGDYYHDGDIGGGQYLNACVWFEIITGQSCVGNTFRPKYDLDANITYEALQQAAHQAVESLKNS